MNKLKMVVVLIGLMMCSTLTVHADNEPLGVKVINTEKLETKDELNFKLNVGEVTQAQVELVNKSQQDKKVSITINNATNDENGQLIYNSPQAEVNDSKLLSVPKVMTADREVVIEANSKKVLPLTIKMPDQKFTGIILGGITFLDESSRGEVQEGSNMGIINQMSYTLPIIIRQTDEKEEAKLELKQIKLSEKGKTLEVGIDNLKGHILPNVDVTYVIKTRSGKVIDTFKTTGGKLAPHHTYVRSLSLKKLPLTSSKYTIDIKAESDHGNWKWSENFELSSQQRFEKVKEILNSEVNWMVVFGVIIVLLLLVLILIQLIKMKKK